MTDSMKFGPEWLRNLSTDSTSPGANSLGSGNTSNNNSSSNLNNISGVNLNNSNTASPTPTPRNMFPEFRYGREEMLLLFDKNCNLPEILPTFKKIYVEKVQFPLALTPSTDEEITPPGPTVSAQRPQWSQRSPVGFSSAVRGTGRGGSADRGRMRGGKLAFHTIYPRPAAMFEDDLRLTSLKSERGWSERNGTSDALSVGSNNAGHGSEWNGTPSSSPRKEFSSYARNTENWRRNRNEDSTGDSTPGGSVPSSEGWRGGSSANSFGSNHRWGRSTSWRDEDASIGNIEGISFSPTGVPMQRSYSTIASTGADRSSYIGGISKSTSQNSTIFTSSGASPPNRGVNSSGGNNVQSRQWVTGGDGQSGNGAIDGEDNLPEWAMENASDIGGTFDATGAFHGSGHDDDPVDKNKKDLRSSQRKKFSSMLKETSFKSDENVESPAEDDTSSSGEQGSASSPSIENCKSIDQKPPSQFVSSNELNASENEHIEPQSETRNQHIEAAEPKNQTINAATMNISPTNNSSGNSTSFYSSDLGGPFGGHSGAQVGAPQQRVTNPDYSDRMKEVADDMVQKLIMDDDSVGLNANNPNVGDGNLTNHSAPVPNAFVSSNVAAILKQTAQQQAAQNVVRVSPTSTPIVNPGNKPIPLYGGGVVVDHDTMQQHHLQQQQLAAAAGTPDMPLHGLNPSTNFWYYRDPQSKVQGPFTAIEMTEWYRAGYFDENLSVRRLCDTRFRTLGALTKLCQGNMPFTHSHLIPFNLDALHIPSATPPISQLRDKPPVLLDYNLKHAVDQRDEMKGSIAGGGESIKNLMDTADMSHMINIQIQEYLRHHEMLVVAELSKSECFLRLTPAEKEAVVRQKLQLGGLPDYIAGLAGMNNSMPTLGNPNVGNPMYEALSDCAKKDHIFSGGSQPHPQQQQTAGVKTFIDGEYTDVLHPQQQAPFSSGPYGNVLGTPHVENNAAAKMLRPNEPLTGNELLNEFNLRMFLRGGVAANAPNPSAQPSKHFMSPANPNSFLMEQQLLVPPANAQNPMMQMWIPPAINANVPVTQQTLMMNQQSQQNQNQWNAPQVAMSNTVMPGSIAQPKALPPSMWDMAVMQQKDPSQKLESNIINFDDHNKVEGSLPAAQLKEPQTLMTQYPQQHKDAESLSELATQLPSPKLQEQSSTSTQLASASTIINKQPKEDQQPDEPQSAPIKRSSNTNNNSANKQQTVSAKPKEENKRSEEDRRREQAEEKRRQKEEKKRLQAEEEKRRSQQLEDEKRRQIQEEKERQQQIQAQRRKALLGNAASSGSSTSTSTISTTTPPGTKADKDHRPHSSVAPWSTQTTAAASKNGPCLAEIQKAERRERRADQQRQMEMMIRANAVAAAEINDVMLTWNAAPMPVKSFAEIQAEESKRLAAEQLETQRRKEQEQQQTALTPNLVNANAGPGLGGSSFSGIWTGNKVWGSTSNSGFWEEPIKFSAAVSANNATGASSNHIGRKQAHTVQQQKSSSSSNNQTGSNPTRNLRKSQTVTVMQNAAPAAKNTKSNQQGHTGAKPSSKPSLKPDLNDNRKGQPKINNIHPSSSSGAGNKKDDMEHEFTGWCTKSLNGMNAKVDVPTFVTFLQDLESPYEVKDYVRMYLGESKEYTDFAKQFLERRSKYRNLQRAQNAHNDDMCKPAPAITPLANDSSDNKNKQKKVKKNKMTKLDARILGFSVTAAEGRINVGDRDYVDAP